MQQLSYFGKCVSVKHVVFIHHITPHTVLVTTNDSQYVQLRLPLAVKGLEVCVGHC